MATDDIVIKKRKGKIYNDFCDDDSHDMRMGGGGTEEDDKFDQEYRQTLEEEDRQQIVMDLLRNFNDYAYEQGIPLADEMSFSDLYEFLYGGW
jgi:hypothetical protein